MTSQYTAVIADDHQIIRQSLSDALSRPGTVEPEGLEIVGLAENGVEALAEVKKHKPNVLLLDISMPLAGGSEIIVDLRRWSPDTAVAVFTGIDAPGLIASLLDSGIEGMFSKAAPLEELYNKLPLILRGGRYIADDFAAAMEQHERTLNLTDRERQTLNMIVAGKTNKEIAAQLSISPKTVDKHRTSLMQKLNVHSLAQLISLALKNGLIDRNP